MKSIFDTRDAIVLMGPPATGKSSTSRKLIKAKKSYIHISAGELVREEIKRGTPLAAEIKAFSENGKLIPDEIMYSLLDQKFKALSKDKNLIIDGYPRTLKQVEPFERLIKKHGINIKGVFLLNASKQFSINRSKNRYYCSECMARVNISEELKFAERVREDNGKLYHKDNGCNGEMIQRKDDLDVKISAARFKDYTELTRPVFDDLKKKFPSMILEREKMSKTAIAREIDVFISKRKRNFFWLPKTKRLLPSRLPSL